MENFQIKGAPVCRVIYVDGLFTKTSPKGTDSTPKYNAVIMIPKSDTEKVNQIKEQLDLAFAELQAKGYKGKTLKTLNPKNVCWVDGEDVADAKENYEFARDYYWLKISSYNIRPVVTDLQKRAIINGVPIPGLPVERISDETLGSGDYCIANVRIYPYNNPAAAGLGCNLNVLVRVKEGEHIGGSGDMPTEEALNDVDKLVDLDNISL